MYTLVRSRYRYDRRGGRWIEADLGNEEIGTLSANYGDIYLYLEYPAAGKPIQKALRWDKVTNILNNYAPTLTVNQWLVAVGNLTLPFESTLPGEKIKYVKYAQAWHSGYNVQAKARSGVDGLPAQHKEDLILTHPTNLPQEVRDNCLISVNGYFHLTDWTDAGVRIIDGNKTAYRSQDNQIGMYSFKAIGKLQFVPITKAMIKPQAVGTPLWDAAYITMPSNINLTKKTVLLVTGGYLNVLTDAYVRVSERTWRISFGKMMFLNRFLQSAKDMDLSSLGLTKIKDADDLFDAQELKNDAVVSAYLTLSQSFFVVVDSESLFQSYEPVQYLNTPGRFIGSEGLQIPLVGAYGRMLDYHIIEEPMGTGQKWPETKSSFVYCATENRRFDYDATHRKWLQGKAVNGGRYPAHPYRNETAYYRFIGVES
jgi:hypothetical protein